MTQHIDGMGDKFHGITLHLEITNNISEANRLKSNSTKMLRKETQPIQVGIWNTQPSFL